MTTIIDGSAGITFPNSTVQTSAGKVIQVVNSTGTSQLSTSSGTPVSLSFTASITPKFSTSNILVQFYGRVYRSIAGQEATIQIWRGGASIQGGYTVFSDTGGIAAQQSFIFLDSPATTSSVTYSLYGAITSGSISVNPNGSKDGIYGFLLQEIAA